MSRVCLILGRVTTAGSHRDARGTRLLEAHGTTNYDDVRDTRPVRAGNLFIDR